MPVVSLYAGLRAATGVKRTHVEGDQLRAVLQTLVAGHPALDGMIFDENGLQPHVIVTVNGNHLSSELGLDVPIGPDDQIAIFPPIAGG